MVGSSFGIKTVFVLFFGSRELSVHFPNGTELIESKLPSYMVPAHLMVLGQFPLTPNGKVDRKALPSPEVKHSLSKQYAAPRTYIEEELAAIFVETLGVERVGVHDSFFELGGHSLLVTRAIFRIREVFHLVVLRHPPAELAKAVAGKLCREEFAGRGDA